MADAQQAQLQQRIAALNKHLNFPGAARLQRALAKEGIRARIEDMRENLTSTQGARQVLQAPPNMLAILLAQSSTIAGPQT